VPRQCLLFLRGAGGGIGAQPRLTTLARRAATRLQHAHHLLLDNLWLDFVETKQAGSHVLLQDCLIFVVGLLPAEAWFDSEVSSQLLSVQQDSVNRLLLGNIRPYVLRCY
jgi:hypothetical protein